MHARLVTAYITVHTHDPDEGLGPCDDAPGEEWVRWPLCTAWVGGEEFAEEWDPLNLSLDGYLGMRGDGGVKP